MTKIEKEERFLLQMENKLQIFEYEISNYELLLQQRNNLVKNIIEQKQYIKELKKEEKI